MRHLLPLLAGLALGCRGAKDEPHVLRVEPVSEVLGFSTERLFTSPGLSVHKNAALAPLPAHLHRNHAETVYVVSGRGRMRVGDEWHDVTEGSLVHVPRGVVHALVPHGLINAISFFSPAFDERDRIFLDETAQVSP